MNIPRKYHHTHPHIQPHTHPHTQPHTHPHTQPHTQPYTHPHTQPHTHPHTQPYTQPYTQPHTHTHTSYVDFDCKEQPRRQPNKHRESDHQQIHTSLRKGVAYLSSVQQVHECSA